MSEFLDQILRPNMMPFVIGFVAIVGGLSLAIVKKLIAHRERMAMIERGIHPDYPPEDEPGNANPPKAR